MHGINQSTRTASTEEESVDHIGFETPRSGVATPHPDLHDKRLPGIMSYFGQVRQDNSSTSRPAAATGAGQNLNLQHEDHLSKGLESNKHTTNSNLHNDSLPVKSHFPPPSKDLTICPSGSQETQDKSPDYPTPPPSQPPLFPAGPAISDMASSVVEVGKADSLSSDSELVEIGSSQVLQSQSHPIPPTQSETDAIPNARPISPSHAHTSTPQAPPTSSEASVSQVPTKWFSLEGLKQLTRGVMFKSGPPTPTRALSTANSHSDGRETPIRTSHDGAEHSGTLTPRNTGAQVPAAKGRLKIKIIEARGLRKSRDPYVVAVFQRSELISGPPRPSEADEHFIPTSGGLGGIPIQRQASDSGRPMAIPMRSRQSSNTSISDYNTFRSRPNRPLSANPKWDAEAIFDVVDSDMLVDISVYDHTTSGEEFLGHVNIQARKDKDGFVRGWFALQGHANTMEENAPTGEILVEAMYQRTERKHFGPTDFEILKLIGKGTFGQVYQVRKKDTQRIYAMKVLQKKVIVQKKEVAHTVGERNILVRTATSDSPFIVGLKFSFQTPSELYLVTDYMSGGELFWHLQKEGRFDEARAKFYIAELILAIQHLHNNDIVYRDLKPENILLDANGHIALCDFGLSKANLTKNDTTNTFCGTTEYLAPEVLLDESGYTKMVDFWSLGVLVFEMCCGWSPFYAEDTQQMYKNIAFGKVRFPRDTLSQEGRNFVKGLLNRNPKHRLGATDDAEELKRHAFFNDIDWNLLARKLITPPFKPKLKSETDVSYFDPEFTTALDQNGSLNERAAALARGYAASTPLSPSVQANFQGFTYVDESALEDHMRDHRTIRMDDEDMDDAHTNGDDDDDDDDDDDGQDDEEEWDNLDDIDLKKSNRMSGIVKSSNDEQMVGGSNFDP
ncbi:Serine/threonine-protein kinase SCH9 [Cladobotryum mycophilum]|uniref:Serine/threonine-protein kinase SCH9 n=1 Tax=Cladobotryum mycophilum TaxID=491253 RepID=A0ABR0SFM1_9HYPO